MEDQKNPKQPIPFKKSSWRNFLGKKWAFPAIYIGTAAIILAFVMWYQGYSTNNLTLDPSKLQGEVTTTTPSEDAKPTTTPTTGEDAVAVTNTATPLSWPVANGVKYELGMSFFDDKAPKEKQQAAMVQYQNQFMPHTGIDLTSTDGKSFEVAAALAGKVVKVGDDPIFGKYVEIEHANKMVTKYLSLENYTVKINDEVTQGQVIGKAGRCEYEKEAGTHLHFEVLMDGKNVNPEQYLNSEVQSQ